MASTTIFIVENQEFFWWILAFIVGIYTIRMFVQVTLALFFGWRNNKIKGRIK